MKSLPFVLGTDILRIARFDPINRSPAFVATASRILHPQEALYWQARSGKRDRQGTHLYRPLHEWLNTPSPPIDEIPWDLRVKARSEADRAASWLAGRWTAKEAAKKAWGASILSWKDVRVELDQGFHMPDTSRPVKIVCQPSPLKEIDFGESQHQLNLQQEGRLSISHDGEYCIATVIAEPLNEELLSVFKNRALIINEWKENGWKRKPRPVQDKTTEQEAVDGEISKANESEVKSKPLRIVYHPTYT